MLHFPAVPSVARQATSNSRQPARALLTPFLGVALKQSQFSYQLVWSSRSVPHASSPRSHAVRNGVVIRTERYKVRACVMPIASDWNHVMHVDHAQRGAQ